MEFTRNFTSSVLNYRTPLFFIKRLFILLLYIVKISIGEF